MELLKHLKTNLLLNKPVSTDYDQKLQLLTNLLNLKSNCNTPKKTESNAEKTKINQPQLEPQDTLEKPTTLGKYMPCIIQIRKKLYDTKIGKI